MANTNLKDMKLPELRELAKQMMLRGTSTMRKPELIDVIERARSGGDAPAGVSVKTVKPKKAAAKKTEAAPAPAPAEEPAEDVAEAAPVAEPEAPAQMNLLDIELPPVKKAPARARKTPAAEELGIKLPSRTAPKAAAKPALDLGVELPRRARKPLLTEEEQAEREASRHQAKADLNDILSALPDRSERERAETIAQAAAQREARAGASMNDRRNRLSRADRMRLDEEAEQNESRGRVSGYRHDDEDADERYERTSRRASSRYDERGERSERADRTEREDSRDAMNDDLIPVAGVVDILDSYAFVRTSGYLPGPNDVYVSMGQVKKYGLRKGDAVRGYIKNARDDRRNQRQKFVPLQSIETINGLSLDDAAQRPQFSKLTPLYPQERLKMETAPNNIVGRIIDIVSPIGKGQRGLIVSPPKAGKTITLQSIANSITANNPEVHLMVVLVDERPEEVTDMERTVQGEIISSTFDRPATDHTIVAELAIERAKRLVELGQDVVVLLDSMTRLARAYNIAAPASGRILSGGVDAQALYPPKKFFGAARNIENGGSLTIISSALVETGSKMDEVIFEEFKGTGNMELRLSRELSEKRLFPAIDINASSTRREELITDPSEMPLIYRLRRALGGLEPEASYQQLVGRLKKTQTNAEFFRMLAQGN
ncbi:transcription termination factor Rho [Alloscardovia macacae]|uniref:Transcription termination factor Rho n=1 Tax=Alloscardovia macacae TaxID=1160091 RepID=A0A261F790_9BIFI|nr:transcription termination factor Rho [Alloscardovia macacae]OZG54997.1 transcription termination factor Rho [Alloscardovia macacae]